MATVTSTNYTIQERINARLLSAGNKTIDEVREDRNTDRVNVYCYAIDEYGYDIMNVDARYEQKVKEKLGI